MLKGRVRAVRFAKNGEEVLLNVGGVGYWFAVYGMLANAPTIGSVIADTPVVILNLSEREFARKDMLDTRKLEHTTNAGANEIKVSQSDLAIMVGVSLARLVAKGRIEVKYRRIRLLP